MLEALLSKAMPSLISAGGSLLTGFLNNSAASARQDSAQEFSADQYATRYQTSVADMKAAGLNPMLAYGGLSGSSPTSSAASSAGTPDLGQAYIQSKLSSAQVANVEANTRKTNADANITEQVGLDQAKATLQRTLGEVGLTAAQIEKVTSETNNNIATLQNIKDENLKIRRAAELLYQQANLTFQQGLSETKRYSLLEAQAKLYIAQAGLANLDIDAAKSLDNLGRTSKELKPAVDIIRGLLRK
jgi:hypothetical protein